MPISEGGAKECIHELVYTHKDLYTVCPARARKTQCSERATTERDERDVFHGDESNNQSNRENDPRNVVLLIRNCK